MSAGKDRIPVDVETPSGVEEAPDQRFIAVRPEDLACAIEDRAEFGGVSRHAGTLMESIASVVALETMDLRRELDRRYATFNPDRDTVDVRRGGGADEERLDELRAALRYVFEKANFLRLDDVQIEEALAAANSAGLRVRLDPEAVESLDLYVRGLGKAERRKRTIRRPIKGEARELEVYRRLGVVVRLKGTRPLVLKLYRDIPVADVEALLPHAEVQMGWVDRAKVACGGAGALGGVAAKVVKGGLLLSPSSMAVPVAVALGGLSVKSFLGYRRARHHRVSQRTHHLYNLHQASNAAVLHVLLSLVASQEINEAMLLYAFLSRGEDADEVDGAIEGWLGERFGVRVDFDHEDAVETLDRLRLWEDRGAGRVLGPEAAIERLRAHALDRQVRGYHLDCAGIRG